MSRLKCLLDSPTRILFRLAGATGIDFGTNLIDESELQKAVLACGANGQIARSALLSFERSHINGKAVLHIGL